MKNFTKCRKYEPCRTFRVSLEIQFSRPLCTLLIFLDIVLLLQKIVFEYADFHYCSSRNNFGPTESLKNNEKHWNFLYSRKVSNLLWIREPLNLGLLCPMENLALEKLYTIYTHKKRDYSKITIYNRVTGI